MVSKRALQRRFAQLSKEAPKSLSGGGSTTPPVNKSFYDMPAIRNRVVEYSKIKLGYLQTRLFHLLTWIRGQQRQHFGPTCRLPELFHRRDHVYYALSMQKLRWHLPAPRFFHDIFEVAEKVRLVESQIGYIFKNRMLCVEALKMSGSDTPIYFEGTIHPVLSNKRLALLGDRALSLALCEKWFYAGHSTRSYSNMDQDVMTRANLSVRGKHLGLHEGILKNAGLPVVKPNMVAETMEAILGAVYVDSGNRIAEVTKVLKRIELDRHRYLQEKQPERPERPES